MRPLLAAPGRPALRIQSDQRLIELAAGGFEPAFEVLVLRHRTELLRYCRRIVGEDKAEDVVQTAFVRAYEVITSGGKVDNLRSWLFRVVHNAALDALKDRALHHVQLDEGLNGVERPDQAYERSQRLRDVIAAVQRLPARQRDAIVLRELEGRSYDEIARELAVTDGAVRQLLVRARTTLRATCSALTPYSLLHRVPWAGSEPVTARVAEVVGGAGAPVVVAQVCAAAIVTCMGGGAVAPEPQRDRTLADRGGYSAVVSPPARQLATAVPATDAAAPAAPPARTAPRLVPPKELPRTAPEPPPAPRDERGPKTVPVKLPAPAPKPKAPAAPPGPAYDYAYPGGGPSDPKACIQRRRARSSCGDSESEEVPPEEQPAEPAPPPPPDTSPPTEPPTAGPPPAGTRPSNPPPAGPPPPPATPPPAVVPVRGG